MFFLVATAKDAPAEVISFGLVFLFEIVSLFVLKDIDWSGSFRNYFLLSQMILCLRWSNVKLSISNILSTPRGGIPISLGEIWPPIRRFGGQIFKVATIGSTSFTWFFSSCSSFISWVICSSNFFSIYSSWCYLFFSSSRCILLCSSSSFCFLRASSFFFF